MTNMNKQSAGLLMYRFVEEELQIFLVHPGGPFFVGKDEGVWSIPKGEIEEGDRLFQVALREFEEETGQNASSCSVSPEYLPLGSVVQKNGKKVHAWAFEGNWPEGVSFQSNHFSMEWPPGSGQTQEFPEVDKGGFFSDREARIKINSGQCTFIDRLIDQLN